MNRRSCSRNFSDIFATSENVNGMNFITAAPTSLEPRSVSPRKRCETPRSAFSGHGWNQSITVELIIARKRCARVRNCSPTGEHVNTMCRFVRTLSMKNFQTASRESGKPAAFASPRTALMMSSTSSGGNRSGISPEDSRSLMKTMNFSSVICESVNSHSTPSPFRPADLYIFCRSSRSELTLYEPEMTIMYVLMPHRCAESFESDCLPEPPTPTSRAWPPGLLMMREILQMCFMASSKSTKSIVAFVSLYSSSVSSRIFWSLENSLMSLYTFSSIPPAKWQKIRGLASSFL